ncbi:hypothetical protein LCGC14_1127490 [marine sediment metagenome]|uniref:Uncharacterized protein n=2 Tax=root TaxID=1 RepID=A0A831QN50_9FLAO|nr:hypothetical protein [Pricia antarctica]
MRILFIVILIIHGLIHFMGFAKAFDFGNIAQFTKEISKPMGLLWLLTGLLFFISAILYLMKKDTWPLIAIIAVVLSQLLIFMVWKDAKFGTIANIIILFVGIVGLGHYQFDKMVRAESKQLLQNVQTENHPAISKTAMERLPEIVQKSMRSSGVIGQDEIVSVRLQQKGEMKTKPEGKWMPFTATQYFNVEDAAFIWTTEVDFMPMVNMAGRDKLIDGKGEMLIKLANMIPVVDEGNNEKVNSGAMLRYMAEMVWFPSAMLNDYIKWEAMDANAAKATFTLKGESVSGIYTFSDKGNFKSFEANRYYGGKMDSKLEKWKITASDYKEFNGIKIPNKCSVIWKLREGDSNWLNLEITELEYNRSQSFEN